MSMYCHTILPISREAASPLDLNCTWPSTDFKIFYVSMNIRSLSNTSLVLTVILSWSTSSRLIKLDKKQVRSKLRQTHTFLPCAIQTKRVQRAHNQRLVKENMIDGVSVIAQHDKTIQMLIFINVSVFGEVVVPLLADHSVQVLQTKLNTGLSR